MVIQAGCEREMFNLDVNHPMHQREAHNRAT